MILSNGTQFSIDHVSGVVSAELHGTQTAKSMITCISKVHEEVQFKQNSAVVFNMKDAELQGSFGSLIQMIDFTNVLGSVQGPSRWAFISDENTSTEFLDRFITLAGDSAIKVRRFPEDREARQWLTSPRKAASRRSKRERTLENF